MVENRGLINSKCIDFTPKPFKVLKHLYILEGKPHDHSPMARSYSNSSRSIFPTYAYNHNPIDSHMDYHLVQNKVIQAKTKKSVNHSQ
jgi:hypothetical protein